MRPEINTARPKVLLGAVIGAWLGFSTLFLLDWISSGLFFGETSPVQMLDSLARSGHIFIMKGLLGSITGLVAGVAWAIARVDQTLKPGLVALGGGALALLLLVLWVFRFLLPARTADLAPGYVAWNIFEPTVPAFALILWGFIRILRAPATS